MWVNCLVSYLALARGIGRPAPRRRMTMIISNLVPPNQLVEVVALRQLLLAEQAPCGCGNVLLAERFRRLALRSAAGFSQRENRPPQFVNGIGPEQFLKVLLDKKFPAVSINRLRMGEIYQTNANRHPHRRATAPASPAIRGVGKTCLGFRMEIIRLSRRLSRLVENRRIKLDRSALSGIPHRGRHHSRHQPRQARTRMSLTAARVT